MSKPEVNRIIEAENLSTIERFKEIFSLYVQEPAVDCNVTGLDQGKQKGVYFAAIPGEHTDGTETEISSIIVGFNSSLNDSEPVDDFSLYLTEFDPSTGLQPVLELNRDERFNLEASTSDPTQTELALGRIARMLSQAE